jgi:hypothetical protein
VQAPRRDDREAGFTLPELITSSLLFSLVLLVIVGVVIGSNNTETIVATVTSATSSGQLVSNSLVSGIRNSQNSLNTAVPLKLTFPSGNDQMVESLVLGSATTASSKCKAWYYSATKKSIYAMTSAAAITAPSTAQLSSWRLLATGVTPITGTTVFTLSGTKGLTFSFQVNAGKDPAVPFNTTVTSLTGLTGAIACY